MPPDWRSYVKRHNGFASFTAQGIRALHYTRGSFTVENPCDPGDPTLPRRSALTADLGSLWIMPEIRAAWRETGAVMIGPFSMCMLGGKARKDTCILASPDIAPILQAVLGGRLCPGKPGHISKSYNSWRDQQDAKYQKNLLPVSAYQTHTERPPKIDGFPTNRCQPHLIYFYQTLEI